MKITVVQTKINKFILDKSYIFFRVGRICIFNPAQNPLNRRVDMANIWCATTGKRFLEHKFESTSIMFTVLKSSFQFLGLGPRENERDGFKVPLSEIVMK